MTWFAVYVVTGYLVMLGMVPVILRRQMAPGASLAWLGIIFLHPYIGTTLYAFLGETRLGPNRVERHRALVKRYRPASAEAGAGCPTGALPIVRQAERIAGLPVVAGNGAEFFTDLPAVVARLIADIDAAKVSAHLLYYIYADDGTGRAVAEALMRAARRGVACRLLVDGVGSRVMFRSPLTDELMHHGVKVAAALPAHLVQRRLPRMDLRNHRKLAVIDGAVAYAGSHNLINADYDHCPVGPWFDCSARVTGPIVGHLAALFAEDWAFETDEMLEVGAAPGAAEGGLAMQLVPTGPIDGATYRRVLLAAVQWARASLTLTTPYFVPDEPTLVALVMAADRGVSVRLILPERPDHFFTAAAGRAHFARLLAAGVKIYLFRPGLLHAKTVTVDESLAVFGSANLDVRSFNLNFELSLLLYGAEAARRVGEIQETYLKESRRLTAEEWGKRSAVKRYGDSAISLLSPLL